jgi:hypothetical protein
MVINPIWVYLIIVVSIWDLVWKIISSWRAGRNNQPVWFVFLLVLNTMGILPLVYLAWFQKNQNPKKKISKRRKK